MNIKLTSSITIIEFIISLIVIIVSITIAYATINTKVEALEKASIEAKSDHDVLLIIKTKLEIIQKNTEDIKIKLDTHVEK